MRLFFCAQNKTRTCTPEPAPAPQAGVSTNFTIWAIILRTIVALQAWRACLPAGRSTNFTIWAIIFRTHFPGMTCLWLMLTRGVIWRCKNINLFEPGASFAENSLLKMQVFPLIARFSRFFRFYSCARKGISSMFSGSCSKIFSRSARPSVTTTISSFSGPVLTAFFQTLPLCFT